MSRKVKVLHSFTHHEKGRCRKGTTIKLPSQDADAAVARGDAIYAEPGLVSPPQEVQEVGILDALEALPYHGPNGLLALARDVSEFVEEEYAGRSTDELIDFCLQFEGATEMILECRDGSA